MARKRYAFPAYLPDRLPTNNLTAAINVLPAANGYRPVKSLAAVSLPLSASFKGGAALRMARPTCWRAPRTGWSASQAVGGPPFSPP
ncbi:hypothetical protein AB5I41_30910 [Sphingomonas sp. MMS24-JH45]